MSFRAMASATSCASSIVYGAIVAKLCSMSHGQPVSGSRSAAMISIEASNFPGRLHSGSFLSEASRLTRCSTASDRVG